MKNKRYVVVLVSIICLLLMFALVPFIGVCSAQPMPAMIKVGTNELGTGGHALIAHVAESALDKYTDLKVRLIPAGVDTARAYLTRLGEVDAGMLAASAAFEMQEGLEDYSSLEWGPQEVRYIFCPRHIGMAFGVRGDSGVKVGADLKGKEVAMLPGSPSAQLNNEAALAFFDLTWDDVVPKEYPSPRAAFRAVIDGELTTTFFNLASPPAYEAAAKKGWRWLEMPLDDKEAWARLKKVAPMMSPRLSTSGGGGIDVNNPIGLMTLAYPSVLCWSQSDPSTTYWIAKILRECYDLYKTKDKTLEKDWTPEAHWALWDADVIPMHEGAIRFYKEVGEWTAERHAMNQKRLAYQASIKSLWEQTIEDATEQGVRSSDFPAFWMKARAKAGF